MKLHKEVRAAPAEKEREKEKGERRKVAKPGRNRRRRASGSGSAGRTASRSCRRECGVRGYETACWRARTRPRPPEPVRAAHEVDPPMVVVVAPRRSPGAGTRIPSSRRRRSRRPSNQPGRPPRRLARRRRLRWLPAVPEPAPYEPSLEAARGTRRTRARRRTSSRCFDQGPADGPRPALQFPDGRVGQRRRDAASPSPAARSPSRSPRTSPPGRTAGAGFFRQSSARPPAPAGPSRRPGVARPAPASLRRIPVQGAAGPARGTGLPSRSAPRAEQATSSRSPRRTAGRRFRMNDCRAGRAAPGRRPRIPRGAGYRKPSGRRSDGWTRAARESKSHRVRANPGNGRDRC
jgi:hypothetical protein